MRTLFSIVPLLLAVAIGCSKAPDKPNPPGAMPETPEGITIEPPDDPMPEPAVTPPADPGTPPVEPTPPVDPTTPPVEPTPPGDDPDKKPAEPPAEPPPGAASVNELLPKLADPAERDTAVSAIKAKGAAAVAPLVAALASAKPETKENVVFVLGALGKDAAPALPELKKLAAAEDQSDLRIAAKYAIDAIEGK